jgi:hypothetical protein
MSGMRKYNEAALTLEKLNSNSAGRVSERRQYRLPDHHHPVQFPEIMLRHLQFHDLELVEFDLKSE